MLYKDKLFSTYSHRKSKTELELDFSNYATKSGLKNATGVDTSQFAKKDDLANLKPDVDRLDIDKLEKVQSSFNNLKDKVDKLDVNKLAYIDVGQKWSC